MDGGDVLRRCCLLPLLVRELVRLACGPLLLLLLLLFGGLQAEGLFGQAGLELCQACDAVWRKHGWVQLLGGAAAAADADAP
jgi:hypothetical protein